VEWFWWDWSLSQWPTVFLQCFDAVGLVIWPVKIVPEMTYKVSSGTLNLCSLTRVVLSRSDIFSSGDGIHKSRLFQRHSPATMKDRFPRHVQLWVLLTSLKIYVPVLVLRHVPQCQVLWHKQISSRALHQCKIFEIECNELDCSSAKSIRFSQKKRHTLSAVFGMCSCMKVLLTVAKCKFCDWVNLSPSLFWILRV